MTAASKKKRTCLIFWASMLVIGWGCQRSLPLPKIAFTGMDPVVAAQISNSVAEVKGAPRSAASWGKLAMVLKAAGLQHDAKQCFARAEKLEPKNPRWPYFQDTVESLKRAVVVEPGQAFLRIRLGQLFAEAGRWPEANEHFRAAEYSLGLAQVAYAQGQWQQAVPHLQRARQNKHTAQTATALLATVHLRLGRTNEARELSAQAAEMPSDPELQNPFELEAKAYAVGKRVWIEQAQEALGRKDLVTAGPIIERLITHYPNASESWLYLGRACVIQSNLVVAEQALSRHLQLDPASVDGHLQMGLVRYQQNRPSDAATEFATALRSKPDSQTAHYLLGQVRRRMGDKEGAKQSFQQALRCDPDFVAARNALDELTRNR
jgi:tetratricopeptide (TPR) repeat protein